MFGVLDGTIVNGITVVLGGLLGSFLRVGIPDRIKTTVMQGLSLSVMLIGITMALRSENILIVILSLVLGGIIGELLKIEERLENLGQYLENKVGKGKGEFSEGFVTASLVYCVGAMAIMGSLESGLTKDHGTLYAKAMLDGFSSIIFASSLGIGVAFSSIPVVLYQGLIALTASFVEPILIPAAITEMTATGGLLILGIGMNILGIAKVRVGNLLPSVFIALTIALFWV